jgi:DNA-binding NarL/FixJ family response regulator
MNQAFKTLLIVDDSALIIERLIDMFKESPVIQSILTAGSYQEAVEELRENKIDIVLLDIQLQGKNGIELLEFIVKQDPEVKVMMLTNLVSNYYKKLCEKKGAAHFIDKSKDFELVPQIINSL